MSLTNEILNLWSTPFDSKVLEHKKQALPVGHHAKTETSKVTTEIETAQVTCVAFCPFDPYQNFALVGDKKGKVTLAEVGPFGLTFGTSEGLEDYAVQAVAWMKNSRGEIFGVSTEKDETLVVWAVKFSSRTLRIHRRCLDVISESNHKRLRCIATIPEVLDLIATAGESGTIFIYNRNVVFPSSKIKKAHSTDGTEPSHGFGPRRTEICALVFKNKDLLLSAGAVDRKVKLWDLTKTDSKHQKPVATFETPKLITDIAFSPMQPSKVFVSVQDNIIRCFSMETYGSLPLMRFSGHKVGEKTNIGISPCGNYIASGSATNSIFVWSTNDGSMDATPLFKLKGHSKSVLKISWCLGIGPFKLISASEDNSLRAWRECEDSSIKETAQKRYGCMEVLSSKYKEELVAYVAKPRSPPKVSAAVPDNSKKSPLTQPENVQVASCTDSSSDGSEIMLSDFSTDESDRDQESDEAEEEFPDLSGTDSDDDVIVPKGKDYWVDSQGNEFLGNHVWAKLSKL